MQIEQHYVGTTAPESGPSFTGIARADDAIARRRKVLVEELTDQAVIVDDEDRGGSLSALRRGLLCHSQTKLHSCPRLLGYVPDSAVLPAQRRDVESSKSWANGEFHESKGL